MTDQLRAKYRRTKFAAKELQYISDWMKEEGYEGGASRVLSVVVNDLDRLLWRLEDKVRKENREAAAARIAAREREGGATADGGPQAGEAERVDA